MKESNLQMSAAVCQKHDYRKQKKRRVSVAEDFDPRPTELWSNAMSLLPALLKSVQGESLGISIFLALQHYGAPNISTISELRGTVSAFKESLKMPLEKLLR